MGEAVIEEVPCFHLTGEQLENGMVCPAQRGDDLKGMLTELREDE